MERLTFDGNFCDIARCRELPCPCDGNCMQKQVWERLRAYEDTGISPKACAQAREIEDGMNEDGYSIGRMVELMKADKEGRVVVLPCKAGTPVWRISYRLYDGKYEIKRKYFTLDDFKVEDVGKTIFLIREEAEKALEARNGDQ